MENVENYVENGKCEQNGDTMEQQHEAANKSLLMEYDESDNKVFDFEAHFNGNDEYDDNDDGSLENR